MDADRRRALIITAIVLLVLIALVVGIVWYLIQFIRNRQAVIPRINQPPQVTTQPFPLASAEPFRGSPNNSLPVATNPPTSSPSSQPPIQSNIRVYNGDGFQLSYPRNWGLLTCSNSQNIEFDPLNSTDQRAACDYAIKPITVMVNSDTCAGGQQVTIGGVQVVKLVRSSVQGGTSYKWCTKNVVPLEFSHRVSSVGGRATSKDDFSAQVEQMISSMRIGAGS